MSKKHETFSVVHCGVIVPLKDGKGKCPKCHKSLDVDFKVGKEPEKQTHKKKAAPGPHDLITARIGAGIVFMFVIPTLGASLLIRIGWDNLTATIAFLSFLIGAALLGLFNEKKKKA